MGAWHLQAADSFMFGALTRGDYPKATAGQLLLDLQSKFTEYPNDILLSSPANGYTNIAQPFLSELCNRYEDLRGINKVATATNSVMNARYAVQESVERIMQNTANAQALEGKTHEMQNTAGNFSNKATQLKRLMYWRNLKLKILIGVIIVAILLYIIVPIIVAMDD